jgi:hypothetical protein
MIYGKSSAPMTGAGARSFSVADATVATSTAPTAGTMLLVLLVAARRSESTGVSRRRRRRPLHGRAGGASSNEK